MNKQIKRVMFLTDMLEDLLSMKLNYQENWQKWNDIYKEKGSWVAGDSPYNPTHAELKRLMLLLRQESIKLDKLLTY